MSSIISFFSDNHAVLLGIGLGVSELLANIPSLKSNSIIQFVVNMLKNLEGSSAPKA